MYYLPVHKRALRKKMVKTKQRRVILVSENFKTLTDPGFVGLTASWI